MTLQELIGELNTLALAYPPDTPIQVEWRETNRSDVVGIFSLSEAATVSIIIEAQ